MINNKAAVTEKEIVKALDKARFHELRREFDLTREAMRDVWGEIEKRPQTEKFVKPIQAEILLRCGCALSWFAGIKQTKNYQLTARDWLTEAYFLFEELDNKEKSAETQIEIAMSYCRAGSYKEAYTWFESASPLIVSALNYVGLKFIVCSLLNCFYAKDYEGAEKIIKENEYFIELSNDPYISYMKVHYYINSALVMRSSKRLVEALERYQKTIKYALEIGNNTSLAIAYNNIGNVYFDMRLYDQAIEYIDLGLKLCRKLKDLGLEASFYDSKAQIYVQTGKFNDALKYVEKSIKILRGGDDAGTLAGSLWTKTRVFLALGQPAEALICFSELHLLVSVQISEAAAEGYARDFAKLFYIKRGEGFHEEILFFERSLIQEAFRTGGGLVIPAANHLGITPDSLSNMLHQRHDELREKFGIKEKIVTADSGKTKSSKRKTTQPVVETDDITLIIPPEIKVKLLLSIKNNRLDYIGLRSGTMAVVVEATSDETLPRLVRDVSTNEFYCGFLDDHVGLVGVMADGSEPILIEEFKVEIVGMIVGYCENDKESGNLVYHPLENL